MDVDNHSPLTTDRKETIPAQSMVHVLFSGFVCLPLTKLRFCESTCARDFTHPILQNKHEQFKYVICDVPHLGFKHAQAKTECNRHESDQVVR